MNLNNSFRVILRVLGISVIILGILIANIPSRSLADEDAGNQGISPASVTATITSESVTPKEKLKIEVTPKNATDTFTYTLKVEADPAAGVMAKLEAKEGVKRVGYKITMIDGQNQEVTAEFGTAKITLPLKETPENVSKKYKTSVYTLKSDGTLETLANSSIINDGYNIIVTFTTDHFSEYVIEYAEDVAATPSPAASPTVGPSATPMASPSASPTANPSASPTASPSVSPSPSPSAAPNKSLTIATTSVTKKDSLKAEITPANATDSYSYVLSVETATAQGVLDKMEKAASGAKRVGYDIRLRDTMNNSTDITTGFGTAKITIPLEEAADAKAKKYNATVYTLKDNALEKLTGTAAVDNGTILVTFSTNHFSDYVVEYAAEAENNTDNNNTDNNNNNNNNNNTDTGNNNTDNNNNTGNNNTGNNNNNTNNNTGNNNNNTNQDTQATATTDPNATPTPTDTPQPGASNASNVDMPKTADMTGTKNIAVALMVLAGMIMLFISIPTYRKKDE